LPACPPAIGPTDAEEIVRHVVKSRCEKARRRDDQFTGSVAHMPPVEQHLADVWNELEARAAEPDEAEGKAE
jgi:hypothetical protein